MKSDRWQLGRFEQSTKVVQQTRGVDRRAGFAGKDEIALWIFPQLPKTRTLLSLEHLMGAQDLEQIIVERGETRRAKGCPRNAGPNKRRHYEPLR
jgi:hypothetical protein